MGNIRRRLVHIGGIGFPLTYLSGFLSWTQLRGLLVVGLLVTLVLEAFRLLGGLKWGIYDYLTRSYEADNLAGYAIYMVGITAVGLAFRPHVAIPGMLMLMLGDPVSGYLGDDELRRIKRPTAMIAMFAVSVIVTAPFALVLFESYPAAAGATTAAAGAATIADGMKPRVATYIVDDNLTIPIAGAGTLYLATVILVP